MKLLGDVIRRMQRWWQRANLLVILVPDEQQGSADGVAALRPHLQKLIPRKNLVHINKWCPHFSDAVQVRPGPSRMVLIMFAHPAPKLTGFAVNPTGPRNVLLLTWWQGAGVSFDIAVAHVCNGASILSNPPWSTVFPKWVSYEAWIDGFFERPTAVARWTRIADATVKAALDSHSPRNIANRIKFAYIKEMMDIEDRGNAADGDHLNFMYFQNAIDAMTTSEDI
jgi:hypothetical protein